MQFITIIKIYKIVKKKIEYTNLNDNRLKEFLMTTFLVILVYELIDKIFWTYIFGILNTCNIHNNSEKITDLDNLALYFSDSIKCTIVNMIEKVSDWLFSTIPGASTNLLITIYSLATTGLLIGIIYKFAKFYINMKILKII